MSQPDWGYFLFKPQIQTKHGVCAGMYMLQAHVCLHTYVQVDVTKRQLLRPKHISTCYQKRERQQRQPETYLHIVIIQRNQKPAANMRNIFMK
jgi:hypothetical protein